MTAPRQVLKGTSYLVTRRCLHRQFLLRPCAIVEQVFSYVLALSARRYGVRVHAYCVLSNHYHLVVTDPDARLPAFQQYLDAFVARAVNAHLGRWETFWAPSSFSAVALASAPDVVEKTAYVLANPVAAGLVPSGRQWPGLWSRPEDFGGELIVKRPAHFFAEKSHLPESVPLELSVPLGFESAAAFRAQVDGALAVREDEAHRRTSGFLGADRVLAQRPLDRPRPCEPRRGLIPRVGARDRWKRVELIRRLKTFLSDYRVALREWRAGHRSPTFPAGTYLMRVAHGVTCAGAG